MDLQGTVKICSIYRPPNGNERVLARFGGAYGSGQKYVYRYVQTQGFPCHHSFFGEPMARSEGNRECAYQDFEPYSNFNEQSCAAGSICQMPDSTRVYNVKFGANRELNGGRWYHMFVTGSFPCTHDFFGAHIYQALGPYDNLTPQTPIADPVECRWVDTANEDMTADHGAWELVAPQTHSMTFATDMPRFVKYGAGDLWRVALYGGSQLGCDNAQFISDPTQTGSTIVNHCYVLQQQPAGITGMTGEWQLVGSNTNSSSGFSMTMTEGVTFSNSETHSKSFAASLSLSVSKKASFLGSGVSSTMTATVSASVSKSMTSAFGKSASKACTASCTADTPYMFQWVMSGSKSCGEGNDRCPFDVKSCHFRCTHTIAEPPCELGNDNCSPPSARRLRRRLRAPGADE